MAHNGEAINAAKDSVPKVTVAALTAKRTGLADDQLPITSPHRYSQCSNEHDINSLNSLLLKIKMRLPWKQRHFFLFVSSFYCL